jgi:hypothetical protein
VDTAPVKGFSYYYVRVVQKDEEMALVESGVARRVSGRRVSRSSGNVVDCISL